MNLLDLTGKKALVVGAGGIGAALAEGLARREADVVTDSVCRQRPDGRGVR
jgi:NAD(P)-dependent dehydrogenase (short-subunit alcohol dehydrogenase family)